MFSTEATAQLQQLESPPGFVSATTTTTNSPATAADICNKGVRGGGGGVLPLLGGVSRNVKRKIESPGC